MPQTYVKDILEANVYDVAIETPIQHARFLSRRLNNEVYIKREDLQPVFSFKLRGAYNKMCRLSDSERKRGVVAASRLANERQLVVYSRPCFCGLVRHVMTYICAKVEEW